MNPGESSCSLRLPLDVETQFCTGIVFSVTSQGGKEVLLFFFFWMGPYHTGLLHLFPEQMIENVSLGLLKLLGSASVFRP